MHVRSFRVYFIYTSYYMAFVQSEKELVGNIYLTAIMWKCESEQFSRAKDAIFSDKFGD